jgi:hypothetical protein
MKMTRRISILLLLLLYLLLFVVIVTVIALRFLLDDEYLKILWFSIEMQRGMRSWWLLIVEMMY